MSEQYEWPVLPLSAEILHLDDDMLKAVLVEIRANVRAAVQAAQPEAVGEPVMNVTLTRDEAEYIAAFVSAEDNEPSDEVVTLMVGNGHSGYGLYAAHPEYPEEGAVFMRALAATPTTEATSSPNDADTQPRLTVRVTSYPESNGKRNWTAMLVRVEPWDGLIGNCGGITIDRGELWNRVAYAAECARFLLGERDSQPHILDYGDDIETPDKWAGETRGG